MKTYKLGVLVGSLREGSYTKKIADYMISVFPDEIEAQKLEIGNLPLFNQDFDDFGHVPESWERFRKECQEMDAFLILTPEYNRSIPAVLKNALDVGSRPYGKNMFGRKPGAIISVSIGGIAGFGANHHLRQVATFLDIYMMQQPELYIGQVDQLLNEKGELANPGTEEFLKAAAGNIIDWIKKFD